MRIFRKLVNRNYLISTILIVVGAMLLESTISNFILKYIKIPELLLSFLSLFFIIILIRLISEEILEVN